MDYRTPLAKARGLGSAKAGTAHWWMQRVTAAALIPLSLWWLTFIGHLLTSSYPSTVIWLSKPLNSVLMIAWILAVFYHAGLGLQVVIEDYVYTEWLKIVSVWIVKLTFILLALVAVVTIFNIGKMV
ncbi:succinate dehydrogenase, hydrophobic membrane anchor protein [Methylobacter sp. YRD-M1]|uniref:succinate dehydrogenase, hydrophobic membrane anchor protein n=1 Tax=Methylobacter sp. YRD-M1 TaxID=2911520 RepID=UPI00227B6C9D|nr:succinate dehydrogenase, hydrophobic membrane anchor protein [Methylobacter sp. YRD-M1]WAK00416.1 succinate dehydrogenase, hydrophobic membrane anchor protein [Methylobacter sp. YRD-M1]